MSVCAKHGEYVREGETCRWCAPSGPEAPARYVPIKRITRAQLVEMFGEPTEPPQAWPRDIDHHMRNEDGTIAYDDRCAECRRARRANPP